MYIRLNPFFRIIGWPIFIITISTLFGIFFQGIELFSSFTFYFKFTFFGYSLGFSFWFGHWAISSYTEKKLDWTKNLKRANVISLSLYIIFGLIVSFTTSYVFSRFILENSGKSLFWDTFIKILIIMFIDLMFIAIFYSTNLTKYWIKSIEKNEELKRENLLAKYEALKNQVNPHFLFNSLNTLSGLVEQKPELATDFIKKLSDIYRYVLEQNDIELVSLHDEMKFVENYIFLLKMRFGEALIFSSGLPENSNIHIVPLGLQMLVENATKHNIISDDMPLKIEMRIEDGFIIVSNNLQKKTPVKSGKKPLGLENLRNRYVYLSGKSVEVIESERKFIVKLPIIEP